MPASDPLGFLVTSGLLPSLPPVYYAAQHRLRSLTLLSDFYQRPMGKSSVLEGAHSSKLVRHPDARLIPESTSMPRHVAAATALSGGVQPEFDAVAPRDLTAAIDVLSTARRCPSGGRIGPVLSARLRAPFVTWPRL